MTAGKIEYEQLFDMKNDPWEMTNIASNPKYASTLKKMKDVLNDWEGTVETAKPIRGEAEKRAVGAGTKAKPKAN